MSTRERPPVLLRLLRHSGGLLEAAREIGDAALIARVEALVRLIYRAAANSLLRANDREAEITPRPAARPERRP